MTPPLKLTFWPDPRLKKVCDPVAAFDDKIAGVAAEMLALMRDAKGVGLAAPQVALNLRLFVMNHDGEPANDRVYVNPVLSEGDGDEVAEEGCLSLPKIYTDVLRFKTIRLRGFDLQGNPIDEVQTGYIARIWQHETDHLNGILLTDRMGAVSKMTNRKLLRGLQDKYDAARTKVKKK
jgi:peptide deformylase